MSRVFELLHLIMEFPGRCIDSVPKFSSIFVSNRVVAGLGQGLETVEQFGEEWVQVGLVAVVDFLETVVRLSVDNAASSVH